MAQILLETIVKGDHIEVMEQFDQKLFEALSPKQAKIELITFTGSKKGDRVHVRFISPFKADWTSNITADYQDEKQAYFIDEGDLMPFGLAYWKHIHRVERIDDTTCKIVDDINYKAKNALLTLLLYPVFLIGFYPRKKVYRAYFGKP